MGRRCGVKNQEVTVQTCSNPTIALSETLEDDCCVRLSDRDAARVLAAIENPPAPNAKAILAALRFLQKHG